MSSDLTEQTITEAVQRTVAWLEDNPFVFAEEAVA